MGTNLQVRGASVEVSRPRWGAVGRKTWPAVVQGAAYVIGSSALGLLPAQVIRSALGPEGLLRAPVVYADFWSHPLSALAFVGGMLATWAWARGMAASGRRRGASWAGLVGTCSTYLASLAVLAYESRLAAEAFRMGHADDGWALLGLTLVGSFFAVLAAGGLGLAWGAMYPAWIGRSERGAGQRPGPMGLSGR